jgi:lipopolysaccharide/colanic/teichoic acid biosynthesis glycosyltransferase
VQSDSNGQLRKIRRYYHPVTWPWAHTNVCALIPVASALTARGLDFTSLPSLRRMLSTLGVPSRDVVLRSGAIDLSGEEGLLKLSEKSLVELLPPGEASARTAQQYRAEGSSVHQSARLLGDVAVLDGAVIEERAVVVGPSVIGARSRIEAGAIVAQCLVMPEAQVSRGTTVRHRVVVGNGARAAGPARRRRHDWGLNKPLPLDAAPAPVDSAYQRTKRVFDATVSAVALLLLSPLMALIALAIKLGSRGPVLYGGEREGIHGKPFKCWKFRSMLVGAEAKQRELSAKNHVDGPQFKMADDPRVTRVGRWLRRLNVDELPQLLNVLLGQMSLVGPRPSPFRENQLCVPWRQGRLSVRPGITGLWQICRHDRENGDFHQWIQYDLLYVRHASVLVDLKILVATVLTMGGRWPAPLERILRVHSAESEAAAERDHPMYESREGR